jgi:alpha-L-rhamnosidase
MNSDINSLIELPSFSSAIDSYTALRGSFKCDHLKKGTLKISGSSWFQVWLDGTPLTEGPARFVSGSPEYESVELCLQAGVHVLTIILNNHGVDTRMLKKMSPFLWVHLETENVPSVPITWKALELTGYSSATRRLNPQLGWCEWCDTRLLPNDNWFYPEFDDKEWVALKQSKCNFNFNPVALGQIQQIHHTFEPIAEGAFVEQFGYEKDDLPVRFFLRDLKPNDLPAQGVWRRYDIGRVRLGKFEIELNLPAGTVVEVAYCESLSQEKVIPFINFSDGASCNLDHYISKGGRQKIRPLAPRGGRFIEVHIKADTQNVQWGDGRFQERCYHGKLDGAFECEDKLLNQIWSVGIETYRACSEDALVDNPTRERGQWTGDVFSVGMNISSVGYTDLRLIRRGLIQSALSANENGLVAGLCPGGACYLGSYAAQWITACLEYYRLTGDKSLLHEGFLYAQKNLEAFSPFLTKEGLQDGIDWPFIDWGYVKNSNEIDLGMNLHLLQAYRSFLRWCSYLNHHDNSMVAQLEVQLAEALKKVLAIKLLVGIETLGYHGCVLALISDMVPQSKRREGINFVKNHIMNCFPNNPSAPRLSEPSANNKQLITPYFAHYAFDLLIKEGEMLFVLEQYRKCWGWMLGQQTGTWLEVFDPRWSHCHQWAGCPTWQLSRYGLGLHPRFDREKDSYDFCLSPGDLQEVRGQLPTAQANAFIQIKWDRMGDHIEYELNTPKRIKITKFPGIEGELIVESTWKSTLQLKSIAKTHF